MICSLVYEKKLQDKYQLIAGVDEAGRGALAGPVVVAVVILNFKKKIDQRINDSKKLTPCLRLELYNKIINHALAFQVGIVDSQVIDEINILNSTKEAVYQAIEKIKIKPDFLLTDYLKLDRTTIPFLSLKKGDQISFSIAAASIIAKVIRDRIMDNYHQKYRPYYFNQNKGYPVVKHYQAIKKHGVLPIHRRSFKLFQ